VAGRLLFPLEPNLVDFIKFKDVPGFWSVPGGRLEWKFFQFFNYRNFVLADE
jgi:hypothetical protein